MKQYLLIITMLALVVIGPGCATQPGWSRHEMCFGLSADEGRTKITDQQWQQFRDDEIVTRFPDGFTVHSATGYWRSGDETYAEPSMVLMVVAPETPDTRKKLDAIAQAYAQRFRQQSVLEIKSHVDVDFHN